MKAGQVTTSSSNERERREVKKGEWVGDGTADKASRGKHEVALARSKSKSRWQFVVALLMGRSNNVHVFDQGMDIAAAPVRQQTNRL